MNKDTQSWSNSNLTEMEELLQKMQQLQRENAALRSLVQHWYKLVPENIRSSIEDAQKENKP
jgi:cell shape-determining protein MreC